jgi:hypothetical protein
MARVTSPTDIVHLPEGDRRQGNSLAVVGGDLQHGEIGLGVAAHQAGIQVAAIAERDSIWSAASTTWLFVRT